MAAKHWPGGRLVLLVRPTGAAAYPVAEAAVKPPRVQPVRYRLQRGAWLLVQNGDEAGNSMEHDLPYRAVTPPPRQRLSDSIALQVEG
jgi:hypothetical protein